MHSSGFDAMVRFDATSSSCAADLMKAPKALAPAKAATPAKAGALATDSMNALTKFVANMGYRLRAVESATFSRCKFAAIEGTAKRLLQAKKSWEEKKKPKAARPWGGVQRGLCAALIGYFATRAGDMESGSADALKALVNAMTGGDDWTVVDIFTVHMKLRETKAWPVILERRVRDEVVPTDTA